MACVQADLATAEYKRAVELQPGYVTAWNNLGDAYERAKQWRCAAVGWAREAGARSAGRTQCGGGKCKGLRPGSGSKGGLVCPRVVWCDVRRRDALAAYQEVLSYAPTNEVALQRSTACRQKIERMSTTSL